MISAYLINTIYIAFRLMPIIVVAPLDAFRRIPVLVRVILTIAIALVLSGVVPNQIAPSFGVELSILISEFILGSILSLSFHAVAASVHFAGQLIDMQIGFIAGAVFDPASQQMAGPVSKLFGLSLLAVFFVSGFHLTLIEGFKALYDVLPSGALFSLQAAWYSILGRIFILGFIFASPIIIVLSLVDVCFAIISRSLPQAQVYFVGLPLKVGIGLVMLAVFLSTAAKPLLNLLLQGLMSWDSMIQVAHG